MYHLKSNKTIVFENYLYFEYDYKLEQNFFYKNSKLGSINTLNFVGYYYLNGIKLPESIRIRLSQEIVFYELSQENSQLRLEELDLDIKKLKLAIDLQKSQNIDTLVKGLNSYFKKNPYLPLKMELLSRPSVKEKITDIFSDLEKGKLFYDKYSSSFK